MTGIPLFGSWTEHWDPSSKLPFYYDSKTGLTSWHRPPTPPDRKSTRNDNSVAKLAMCRMASLDVDCNANHFRDGVSSKDHRHDENGYRRSSGSGVESSISRRDEVKTKDYHHFAQEYVVTAPFRDTAGSQPCVMCQRRRAYAIFFPCEHKCVCRRCINTEGFGGNHGGGGGSDQKRTCPVCCQQVQYIVPYKDGKELETYWRWVEEVRPSLPRGFIHKFHMAAILLKIKSEPDSHKTWDRPAGSCGCILS